VRSLLLISTLLLSACIEGTPEITVGTGAENYAPLNDGDEVQIARGLQGGTHIWGAVRASRGLDPVQLELKFSVLKNGVELSGEPSVFHLNLIGHGEFNEVAGLRGIVPDPQAVAGQELVLKIVATDNGGRTAEHQRKVIARAP
jgi:hypothetical protein